METPIPTTRLRLLTMGPVTLLGIAAAATLVGCSSDRRTWRDSATPQSPCFDANLADGLDETSTDELRDVFDCLNQGGNFDPLGPTVNQLNAPSRSGSPAGTDLARAVNEAAASDLDVFALLGSVETLVDRRDDVIAPLLDLALELTYGEPATTIGSSFPVDSPERLDAGTLTHLAEPLRLGAGALLDHDATVLGDLGEWLEEGGGARWARTAGDLAECTDGRTYAATDALLPDLGAAMPAIVQRGRPVAEQWLTGTRPVVDDVAPPVETLLNDESVRYQLLNRLPGWGRDRWLEEAARGAQSLAAVDVDGGPIAAGDISALHAFIRLLHDTNRDTDCTIPLWVGSIRADLGNLAVTLLGWVNDLDPDTVQTGAGVLGALVGAPLSQSLLDRVANSGVCPTLTPQVVHDLRSIDRLYDDERYGLLVVFLELLQILESGDQNQIVALADLATAVEDRDATAPLSALVLDLGGQPLIADLTSLIPALDSPEICDATALTVDRGSLDSLYDGAAAAFRSDNGDRPYRRLLPMASAVIRSDETWVALHHFGGVLAEDGSASGTQLRRLPDWLALDPELETLQTAGRLVQNEELTTPLLRVIETDGVTDALLASEPVADEPEVPLARLSRWIVDGTVDAILTLVDRVFSLLNDATSQE